MNTVEKIKKLLDDCQWSVYKLSKLSGVSQSTLPNMFNRNNDLSISTLGDIYNAFGITLSEFFAKDGEMVYLINGQSEILDKWSSLSQEQQSALLKLLK